MGNKADTILSNPSAAFDVLFDGQAHLPSSDLSREDTFARLDRMGVDAILELIASGRLLNEVAISLHVPITYFEEWIRENVTPEQLLRAKRLCAESFALKSILPLLVTYDSAGHATIAKALSERMSWVAERLDPARWGPQRPDTRSTAPVTIVFEGMEVPKSKTIEAKAEETDPVEDFHNVMALLEEVKNER